ncbi:type ISP restriction/modification enzyme, partial [Streptococcus pyogenes]
STNRDWWVIGFNEKNTKANSKKLIENYNYELKRLSSSKDKDFDLNRKDNFIKWTRKLEQYFSKNKGLQFDEKYMSPIMYRP